MKLRLTISLLTALSITHFTVKPAAIEVRGVIEDQKALNHQLFSAARNGNVAEITKLLSAGANINATTENGNTVLMEFTISDLNHDQGVLSFIKSTMRKHPKKIAKALLAAGANINATNKNRDTALTLAANSGKIEVVKTLLEAGANVDINDQHGYTALNKAAFMNHAKVVKTLLKANAEIPKNISPYPQAIQDILELERQVRNSLTVEDGAGGDQAALKIMQGTTKSASEVKEAKEDQQTLNDQLLDSKIYVFDMWAYYKNPDNNYNSPDKCTEKVKALLKQGADVNAQDNYGRTALMMAAKNDRTGIMQILLDNGADVNTADKYNGDTALMKAAYKGEDEAVLILLDNKANINVSNKYGHTALTRATDEGRHRIVQILLNKGVKDNTAERYNETRLIKAASEGRTKAVETLLDESTDINATDKSGNTALMRAAEAGHTEVVNFLLDKGANVNAIDRDGTTAFAKSIRSRNIEMILVLFDKTDINPTQLDNALSQASISLRSEGLCTKIAQILLDKAADLGIDLFSSPMRCLDWPNSEIVNPLLDRGFNINFINQWNVTALMYAAIQCSTEYINTLLDRGADVNFVNKNNKTALMYAVMQRSTKYEHVNTLLNRGASVNITDNNGETALMKAASSGFTEAVNVLLDRGADVNIANKDNETALMKAAHKGYTEIVKALLKRGANINSANKDNDTALILAARPVPEKKGLEAFFSSHHKKTLEDSIAMVNALMQANAEIPEDISEFPEAIQDIIEQERQTRRSRIKSAAKKGKCFPAKASREDGAGGV